MEIEIPLVRFSRPKKQIRITSRSNGITLAAVSAQRIPLQDSTFSGLLGFTPSAQQGPQQQLHLGAVSKRIAALKLVGNFMSVLSHTGRPSHTQPHLPQTKMVKRQIDEGISPSYNSRS